MRYLLVDHIIEYRRDEFIRGVKNVSMSEDFLEFHFPKNPIMPGILLLEAMTQLAGWLQAVSSNFKNWFLLDHVRKSRFYGFAYPGDQVDIQVASIIQNDTVSTGHQAEGNLISSGTEESKITYQGTGLVNGKKKIMAEFEGVAVTLDDIDDAIEQKKLFQILTRRQAP